MKKILSFLGTIILITSGSSNLIGCDNNQLTSEELAKLKAENSKIINGNKFEWMHSQESPFSKFDNKWYVVIWRGNKKADWRIIKFKNDTSTKTIDNLGNQYSLNLGSYLDIRPINLYVYKSGFTGFTQLWVENNNYIKSVYRWDGIDEPKTPNINSKTGEIKY